MRDPVAQLETWRQFAGEIEPADATHAVSQRLESRCAEYAERELVLRKLRRVEQALQRAKPALTGVLGAGSRREGATVRALERGFERSYRKARRAFRTALAQPSDEAMHALRRANKAHQYQLQFLEPLWKKPIKAQRSAASKLSDTLGALHDLAAIQNDLRAEAERRPHAWLGAISRLEAWEHELQQRALHAAALVYAERPGAFQRRISRYIEISIHAAAPGAAPAGCSNGPCADAASATPTEQP